MSGGTDAGVAIAVVAKAPVPGRVKTRMQPALSAVQAADLAAAMLADVTAAACATGAQVWWSYAGDRAVLEALRPDTVRLLAQVGDGLGPRLAHAHTTLHGLADRVLLVGADCPTLDAAALRAAIALLDDHDLVLCPAADGGYTVAGTRTAAPSLFTAVPMSTAHTAIDTLAEARRLGLRAVATTARPDLDRISDLRDALDGGWLASAPRTRAIAADVVARIGA
jgi:rSAM/selenodomain-associated transferase 1